MQTLGAKRRGSIKTYIAMCLLIASAGSLFNPVLSLFLNTELGFDPIRISIFFVLLPIATIIIVQTVAFFSDMGLQRPAIICIAGLFGIVSSALLYMRPNFWVLCTIGLCCLGSYPVAFPQIFASAREYAVKYVHGSIMFTTFLRSLASLSWVVGPPLAYGLAIGFSFDVLFLVTAGMFGLYSITCFFFLPNVLERSKSDVSQRIAWWKNSSVMLLFVSVAFLFTAFSSYMVSMPLYVTQELKLSPGLPGYMMGLAAGLEIPIMILAAKIARTIGLKALMLLGAVALIAYLAILGNITLTTEAQFLWMQIFPAIFIGFIGSMGMVYFQELLPEIPGQATSLYINGSAVGQIAGGAFISLASSGSYQIIFFVGFIMSILGTITMLFVKKPPQSQESTVPAAVAAAQAAAQAEVAQATSEQTEATVAQAAQAEGEVGAPEQALEPAKVAEVAEVAAAAAAPAAETEAQAQANTETVLAQSSPDSEKGPTAAQAEVNTKA